MRQEVESIISKIVALPEVDKFDLCREIRKIMDTHIPSAEIMARAQNMGQAETWMLFKSLGKKLPIEAKVDALMDN